MSFLICKIGMSVPSKTRAVFGGRIVLLAVDDGPRHLECLEEVSDHEEEEIQSNVVPGTPPA